MVFAPIAIFLAVGGVKIVEVDQKSSAIAHVFPANCVDLLLRCDPTLFCGEHDCGAVGVVGAHIEAVVAARFLEPHPDVRLHLLQQMAKV